MARQPSARVRLYRERLDAVIVAVGDGMGAVAQAIVREADPPDATPYGEGLVNRGGWLAYVDGKKIAGGSLDGKQPKPPRAVRVSRSIGVVAIAGFGFPARFQELGTTNHAAQPFLTPAADAVVRRAPSIIAEHVRPKLGRRP